MYSMVVVRCAVVVLVVVVVVVGGGGTAVVVIVLCGFGDLDGHYIHRTKKEHSRGHEGTQNTFTSNKSVFLACNVCRLCIIMYPPFMNSSSKKVRNR